MKQTKTIPFDWEEYNNNRDKYKVVTRNGDEVTQLTKFECVGTFYSLRGVLNHCICSFFENGKWLEASTTFKDLELQYEEEVKGSWVNLYWNNDGSIFTSATYDFEGLAKKSGRSQNYIKTINLDDLV
jgi:hypothetical protein